MKTISRLLAILLVLAMVFTLVACGDSKKDKDKDDKDDSSKSEVDDRDDIKDDDKDDKDDDKDPTAAEPTEEPTEPAERDDIVGTWEGELVFLKVLDAQDTFLKDPNAEYYRRVLEGVSVTMVVDFKADDTFTMLVDEDSIQNSIAMIKKGFAEVLPDLFAAQGMSPEQFEDYLTSMNMTVDELVDRMFDAQKLVDQMKPPETKNGTYTYEDGELTMTDDAGKARVWTVALDGDTLTLISIEESGNSIPSGILPIVFARK